MSGPCLTVTLITVDGFTKSIQVPFVTTPLPRDIRVPVPRRPIYTFHRAITLEEALAPIETRTFVQDSQDLSVYREEP